MTREEAKIKLIEIKAQLEVILSMYGLEISDVFDIAIKALDQIDKVEQITKVDNSVIQEDVLKYKMICEVIE